MNNTVYWVVLVSIFTVGVATGQLRLKEQQQFAFAATPEVLLPAPHTGAADHDGELAAR